MAVEAAQRSQVFLSVGTAAVVKPAASLPFIAREAGAVIVEINTSATPLRRTHISQFSDHLGISCQRWYLRSNRN